MVFLWLYTRWLWRTLHTTASEPSPRPARSSRCSRQERTEREAEREAFGRWLCGEEAYKREAATECLERMGATAAYLALQDLLRQYLRQYRSSKQCGYGLLLIMAALGALIGWKTIDAGSVPFAAYYLVMPAWMGLPFLLLWYDDHQHCRKRIARLLRRLERAPSIETIPLLVEVMRDTDSSTSALAGINLTRLLPQLESKDAALLKAAHYACLRRALSGCNSNLILAILCAFEECGDRRAIGPVKRLMACPLWVAKSRRIRARAGHCLSKLQQRVAAQATAQTLLRPVNSSTMAVDHLLRPAHELPRLAPPQRRRGAEPEQVGAALRTTIVR